MFPIEVEVRDTTEADLPVFFEQQQDPDALHMAAFTAENPADREAFDSRWAKILQDGSCFKITVLYRGQIAGNVVSFPYLGEQHVGYWIGKAFWGKGIASAALSLLLSQIPHRPLYARAAKDNAASVRVLEKCGFVICGEDRGFANARGAETEEYVLKLDERELRR